MNITELETYNLADAVKFHDRLNPRLWDEGEHLRSDVRDKLLEIAEDFKEFLGIDNLQVKDITVSGSNAAYSYTPHSDIDLHLVADLPEADSNEVFRELFDAKKFQYNKTHDIRIGGYDVELYVQDPNQEHASQGIYSLLQNRWLSVPKRKRPEINDISVKSKYEDVGHRIEDAVRSGSLEQMNDTWQKLKAMRKQGLEREGEFSPENLAFKILRSNGTIQKLVDARQAVKDRALSLAESRKKKNKKKVKYGFSGYWFPGYNFSDSGSEGSGDGGGGGESRYTESPDGVNPSTKQILESDNDDIVMQFIKDTAKRLDIQHMPKIHLHRDPEWSKREKSFGMFVPDSRELHVNMANRHLFDILRTTAHELVHVRQHELRELGDDAGATGSPIENEAHAIAGIIMRDFADAHPEWFADQPITEGILNRAAAAAAIVTALNAPAQTQEPQPVPQTNQVQQVLQQAMRLYGLSRLTQAGAKEEFTQEFKNYIRAQGGDANAQNQSRVWQQQQQQRQPQNESASGYIPTKKQAKDPRFSHALTVDIKPGQVGKEANKLNLKTDRQGKPGLLIKSANLREGRMPQPSQGPGRYRDLNEPLGPESPPKMPAGTIKVDVSDTQDWYQLGQDISNLDIANKDHYNQGPPHTVLAFGSEELEHMYSKQLKRLGLPTHDLDEPGEEDEDLDEELTANPTYNLSEGLLEDNMAANDKSIADIRSKLTLVPFFTNPKTNTPVWVYDNSGRYTVVVQYGGMNLPFYFSTGMGGKETVAADQWYPFFGVGTGPKGWINKGSEAQINNYYGSGILKNISKFLDSTFIPRRDPKNVWGWGMNRGLEDEFKKVVNRNFPETQDSGSRSEGFTIDGFARNVNPYLKSLGGMQYGTSDSSTDTKTKTDVAPAPSKPTPAPTSGKEITGPLTLQHNGKEFTTLRISANLGKNSVRQLGDDYKFWHEDQFQLQKDNKDNTWTLIPNHAATNKTIINGQGVTTPVKLKQGMVISVGNPDKKIEKLPITVISKPGVAENALAESLQQELALFEEQDLFEINMSTGSLRREAAKTGAQAGMEFEMIVPNMEGGDLEPEYERDEGPDRRARDFDDIEQFFADGDYNGRGDIRRLREALDEAYMEWTFEQTADAWSEEGLDFIRDYIANNDLFDRDEALDQARDEIIDANPDLPPESEDFQQLLSARLNELEEEFVEDEYESQGRIYNDAFEQFSEEKREDYDETEFLRETTPYMSDVESSYDIQWPYWYDANESSGDTDIDTIAADFSESIGRPVNASQRYSTGVREPGKYVVEPDGSLNPDNANEAGLEFVSPPLPIDELLSDLNKVRAWAGRVGAYTNSSTGLHINISVPNFDPAKLDYVKLALLLGDKYVLEQFGRSSNTYTQSALGKVQDAVRRNPDTARALLDKMRGHMEDLATKAVHSGTTEKYTSINTKDNRIEFRSPGGDWLDENFDKIENTLLRFTVALSAAMNPEAYREEYLKKLYKLLDPQGGESRGPTGRGGKETVKYFADYVAGNLPKDALRDFVKQAQLERGVAKGKVTGPMWWSVTNPANSMASINVVANNAEEAIASAILPGNYPEWARVQNTLKATPLRPYTAPTAKASEPAAQAQGNWGIWIGASQRFARQPGEYPAGQEVPLRRFPTQQAAEQFLAQTREQNPRMRSDVEVREIEPAQQDNWSQDFERRMQPSGAGTASSPVGQNQVGQTYTPAGSGEFTGQWLVLDPQGQVIYKFGGIGNSQADANRVAIQWLRQNSAQMQAGVTVVPEMG